MPTKTRYSFESDEFHSKGKAPIEKRPGIRIVENHLCILLGTIEANCIGTNIRRHQRAVLRQLKNTLCNRTQFRFSPSESLFADYSRKLQNIEPSSISYINKIKPYICELFMIVQENPELERILRLRIEQLLHAQNCEGAVASSPEM